MQTIKRVERPTPQPGEYYRIIEPVSEPGEGENSTIPVGTLVWVKRPKEEDEPNTLRVSDGETTWYNIPVEAFERAAEFCPDPAYVLAQEIATTMQSMHALDPLQFGITNDAKLLTIAVKNDEPGTVSETDIVQLTNEPGLVKQRLAENRNAIKRYEKAVKEKSDKLARLISRQTELLEVKAKEMKKQLAVFEEGVQTINLYLGTYEDIKQLQGGKAAPIDMPITIRQQVLYADEEAALFAEQGGIDGYTVEAFDKWLTEDKAHLTACLPEVKGVVAIKPRRTAKRRDYGENPNLFEAMEDGKKDTATYFLIRNGEKVYRIATNMEVGSTIIPKAGLFDALFEKEVYDGNDGENRKVSVKPGSEEYMEAMERVDATNRHFLRVLLFLQGLIDRTSVFQPLPKDKRLNVFDEAESQGMLKCLRDAENLLSSGHETFDEWQARINSELEIGQRIIGTFDSYAGLRDDKLCKERVKPPTAERPESLRLYTLARRAGEGGFEFLYPRKITKRIGYERVEVEAETRASCRIETDDSFILNFDRATVAEMEYFLNDRMSRYSYIAMFPLLKAALKMKREEEQSEAPFKALLVNEARKVHDLSEDDARERIDALVLWWKLSNTWHRALNSDDAKAYRMILDELRRRLEAERKNRLTPVQENTVIEAVRKACPDAMYVGQRPDGLFVALTPHNRENVFYREQTFKATFIVKHMVLKLRGDAGLRLAEVETKTWRVADRRRFSWRELLSTDRWRAWKVNARRDRFLTDDDAVACMQVCREYMEKRYVERPHTPLALVATRKDDRNEFYFYWQIGHARIPADLLISSSAKAPSVTSQNPSWTVKRGKVEFGNLHGSSWGNDVLEAYQRCRREDDPNTVWRNPKAVTALGKEIKAYRKYANERQALLAKAGAYYRLLTRKLYADDEAAALKRFIDDHNDPQFWEDEKKRVTIPRRECKTLEVALEFLIERHVPIDGRTVQWCIAKAREMGMRGPLGKRDWMERGPRPLIKEDLTKIPLDFVLKLPDKPDDEDDDDDREGPVRDYNPNIEYTYPGYKEGKEDDDE